MLYYNKTMKATNWYNITRKSKGSLNPHKGLFCIHQARDFHQGQFFTPVPVVKAMWKIVNALTSASVGKVSILDNTIGAGSLVRFANPKVHDIYGCDIDAQAVSDLQACLKGAEFDFHVANCGMEEIKPRNMEVALINPPFSIQLSHPQLEPYESTRIGEYGPQTTAKSQDYALDQALDAARYVVAVLPCKQVSELTIKHKKRLCAIYELPNNTFESEGAVVNTCLAVFAPKGSSIGSVIHADIKNLNVTKLSQYAIFEGRFGATRLGYKATQDMEPSIKRAVTGDNQVVLTHSGRNIRMLFKCGFTEARVKNAILESRIEASNVRQCKGTNYHGQGILDIEALLATNAPQAAFNTLLWKIEGAGAEPIVTPELKGYFKKCISRYQREITPFGKTVFSEKNKDVVVTATAIKNVPLGNKWGDPIVAKGEAVTLEGLSENDYRVCYKGKYTKVHVNIINDSFIKDDLGNKDWVELHPPLYASFPEMEREIRARLKRLGIDKILTWEDYQFNDLVEVLIKPKGATVSWDTGLGKARLAACLVYASESKHGLIATEAGLINELVAEIEGLGLNADDWQVLTNINQTQDLKRINIVSYTRLRTKINARGTTWADMMRKKCSTVVSDEADIFCNPHSQQSRAIKSLKAKRTYALSATPVKNYPRDIHPLLVATQGDGTAAQPYGWKKLFMTPFNHQSLFKVRRGIDQFRDDFIVTEWATHDFNEDNRGGAKREVPKINDVEKYRELLDKHVKRRVVQEPDVAKYVSIPEPILQQTNVKWDKEHLAYYLKTCRDFASWYRAQRGSSKKMNLIALLARINAVLMANNFPQHVSDKPNTAFKFWRGGLTAKQAYAVKRLKSLIKKGEKVILFARNPGVLDLISGELAKDGIDMPLYHGGISQDKRSKALDEFREGSTSVIGITTGAGGKGLNIPQASYAILYDRSWDAITEKQALSRLLRPSQKNTVTIERLHNEGSIDDYQGQLVEMKTTSIKAGLDYGETGISDAEFFHLDHIINAFVEGLPSLANYGSIDMFIKEYGYE